MTEDYGFEEAASSIQEAMGGYKSMMSGLPHKEHSAFTNTILILIAKLIESQIRWERAKPKGIDVTEDIARITRNGLRLEKLLRPDPIDHGTGTLEQPYAPIGSPIQDDMETADTQGYERFLQRQGIIPPFGDFIVEAVLKSLNVSGTYTWHPASEEPEEYGYYAVWPPAKNSDRYAEHCWFGDHGWTRDNNPITHWTELPTPPEE